MRAIGMDGRVVETQFSGDYLVSAADAIDTRLILPMSPVKICDLPTAYLLIIGQQVYAATLLRTP